MAEKELGADFAIHGGGIDLVFPHHENEIAQTEAARGVPLAEIWMHNGMVQIDEEKMSKSVGNIFQLSEALDRYGRADRGRLSRLRPLPPAARLLRRAARGGGGRGSSGFATTSGTPRAAIPDPFLAEKRQAFLDALADDFNTPQAFAVLFEIVAEGNRRELPGAREVLERAAAAARARVAARRGGGGATPRPERLLAEREEARAAKDFERADALRDQLAEMGWEVRDEAGGARLVRACRVA